MNTEKILMVSIILLDISNLVYAKVKDATKNHSILTISFKLFPVHVETWTVN